MNFLWLVLVIVGFIGVAELLLRWGGDVPKNNRDPFDDSSEQRWNRW